MRLLLRRANDAAKEQQLRIDFGGAAHFHSGRPARRERQLPGARLRAAQGRISDNCLPERSATPPVSVTAESAAVANTQLEISPLSAVYLLTHWTWMKLRSQPELSAEGQQFTEAARGFQVAILLRKPAIFPLLRSSRIP
jgi:hypothetical protein